MNVYSIFDSKAKAWLPPFVALNDDVCLRRIIVSADPGSDFYRFGEDYTVFRLGSFDEHSGLLKVLSPSEFIGRISNIVANKPNTLEIKEA